MDCFSSRVCERGPDFCNIAKVLEREFDNLVDVGLRGEVGSHQGCVPGRMGRQWCQMSVCLWILLRVYLELMSSSVLSLLSLRTFYCIQIFIADRQELIWERGVLWGILCLRISVIGIAVEVQIEMAENLTEREHVDDEKEWAKYGTLENTPGFGPTEVGPKPAVCVALDTEFFKSGEQVLWLTSRGKEIIEGGLFLYCGVGKNQTGGVQIGYWSAGVFGVMWLQGVPEFLRGRGDWLMGVLF